jgi:hypothetical protein
MKRLDFNGRCFVDPVLVDMDGTTLWDEVHTDQNTDSDIEYTHDNMDDSDTDVGDEQTTTVPTTQYRSPFPDWRSAMMWKQKDLGLTVYPIPEGPSHGDLGPQPILQQNYDYEEQEDSSLVTRSRSIPLMTCTKSKPTPKPVSPIKKPRIVEPPMPLTDLLCDCIKRIKGETNEFK